MLYCLIFVRTQSDPFARYVMNKERYKSLSKFKFDELGEYLAIFENLLKNYQMIHVPFLTPRIHEDIIDKDGDLKSK